MLAHVHELRHVLARQRPAHGLLDLRQPGVDVEHRTPDQLARPEAEQLERLALRHREDAVRVDREQDHRRGFDDRGHLRLRDPQLGLRAAQLGDVDEHALGVQRPAGRVAHDHLLVEQVHDRAILGGHEAVLEVDRDLLARMARELLDDPVVVGGGRRGGAELPVLGPALGRVARERARSAG